MTPREYFLRSYCAVIIFACLILIGCKSTPAKYTVQTSSPDVWAKEPTQNLTIKMEFTR